MKRFRPAVWPLVGLVAGTLAILFLAPVVAQEKIRVGLVNRVQAPVNVTSSGTTSPAVIGTPVHLSDEIETGSGARLQITLRDNTRLTLGEDARLVVDRFVYDPDAKQGAFDGFVTGAFQFVSGRLGEMSDKRLAVRTPVASIGIRGTEFWGGPIDAAYGVFLLSGAVVVRNQGGEVVLDTPGVGTTVRSATTQPTDPVTWPEDKVARARAAVAFR